MDRLYLAIEVRYVKRLPEFPRVRNLPSELVITVMAQADSGFAASDRNWESR